MFKLRRQFFGDIAWPALQLGMATLIIGGMIWAFSALPAEPVPILGLSGTRGLMIYATVVGGVLGSLVALGLAVVLVVISHDRRFLNTVSDHIADIDYETIITYTGNYDEMVRTKSHMRGRIEKDKAQRSKKIAQLQDFIQRFGAGTRASQTRSRQRQIERLGQLGAVAFETVERPGGDQILDDAAVDRAQVHALAEFE